MKKLCLVITSIVGFSISYADDLNGLYIGAGYGVNEQTQSSLNNNFAQVGTSLQTSSTSQNVVGRFGWRYGDGLWSTELSYNYLWNASGGDNNYGINTSAQTVDLDQLLYARLKGTPFYGYVKAGASYVMLNQATTVNSSISNATPNGFTFNGGLGLGIGITRNMDLRLDWTNYGWALPVQTATNGTNGSWSANVYTANLMFNF